jgi:hypothetical protein
VSVDAHCCPTVRGLTPDRALIPSEFRQLLSYGIELTDLAKGVSGMDHTLVALVRPCQI